MKKKLKIYSTLFVVALIVLLVAHKVRFEGYTWYQGGKDTLMFEDNAPEFYTSDTTYHEGGQGVHTIYYPTMSYNVYVRPKMPRDNQTLISRSKWLGQEKPEMQTYRVTMQKVRLETPVKEEGFFINFPIIEAIVSGVLTAVVTIWILCLVFKLVRRIHRGEVFVTQVSKYLEITGYLLSALYLIQWIGDYALTQYCIQNIQLADYHIVYSNDTNSMYLLTGLALMIISQIILMGKEIKEEQELTI